MIKLLLLALALISFSACRVDDDQRSPATHYPGPPGGGPAQASAAADALLAIQLVAAAKQASDSMGALGALLDQAEATGLDVGYVPGTAGLCTSDNLKRGFLRASGYADSFAPVRYSTYSSSDDSAPVFFSSGDTTTYTISSRDLTAAPVACQDLFSIDAIRRRNPATVLYEASK